jgi:2-(1,2-epoxy-1,2-dihydrophenyl)acetyl-CoA isomerase
MNSTPTTVNYFTSGKVATIELDRPEARNAFNQQVRQDLLGAIERAEADDDIRLVIIAAAGKSFSAGADLKELIATRHQIESQILEEYQPILKRISQSDKIFIAAVQGAAAGIGSALALTCDLVVMAQNAFLYQAFAAIALVPDGGASWHLVNQLGYKRALELFMEAQRLSAEQCLQYGLANKVVADEQLRDSAELWAQQLAKGAPMPQKYLKQLLKQAQRGSLDESIRLEASLQQRCCNSQDFEEGMAAFSEKRQPKFNGM